MSNEATEQVEEKVSTEAEASQQEADAKEEADKSEAQEAFAAGFKKVRKDVEPTVDHRSTASNTPAEKPTEAPAKKEEETSTAKPAEQPASKPQAPKKEKPQPSPDEKLNNRIRNLEGNIGAILQKLDKVTAANTTAATPSKPSNNEVQAALADPQKMAKLVKEFPEFQVIQEELTSIRETINKLPREIPQAPVIDHNEIRETVKLDVLHPDWEEIVKSSEWFDFALEGGPSATDYARLQSVGKSDPNAELRMINAWAQQHPQWWAEKGHALFSSKASDSAKLIARYKESVASADAERQKAEQARLKQEQKTQRLARATTPTGMGGAPETGVSDLEAFRRGFKKAFR